MACLISSSERHSAFLGRNRAYIPTDHQTQLTYDGGRDAVRQHSCVSQPEPGEQEKRQRDTEEGDQELNREGILVDAQMATAGIRYCAGKGEIALTLLYLLFG